MSVVVSRGRRRSSLVPVVPVLTSASRDSPLAAIARLVHDITKDVGILSTLSHRSRGARHSGARYIITIAGTYR